MQDDMLIIAVYIVLNAAVIFVFMSGFREELTKTRRYLMTMLSDIQDTLTEISTALDGVDARIADLVSRLHVVGASGLSAEEARQVIIDLDAKRARIASMADPSGDH